MPVSRKLRIKHNYKYRSDNCKNCRHFKTEENYQGVEGMYADSCHVDAHVLDNDDNINHDQDVYILNNSWGS